MSGLAAPKGTFDILPPDSARFLAVRDTLTAPLRRAAGEGPTVYVACSTLCFNRRPLEDALQVIREFHFPKADLAIHQISEILAVPGAVLVAPLPALRIRQSKRSRCHCMSAPVRSPSR